MADILYSLMRVVAHLHPHPYRFHLALSCPQVMLFLSLLPLHARVKIKRSVPNWCVVCLENHRAHVMQTETWTDLAHTEIERDHMKEWLWISVPSTVTGRNGEERQTAGIELRTDTDRCLQAGTGWFC